MEFIDQLRSFIAKADTLKDKIQTEEATKTSLIMPFFQILGYDVFDPSEFTPECDADVGTKKGEKIDYAIKQNGKIIILVEAESITENLDKHRSQLFRYFSTKEAKFGILTNGIEYRFYTDLVAPNKMDDHPFFTINLFDLRDQEIDELEKFHKSSFDVNNVFSTAEDLKYANQIKIFLSDLFKDPGTDFINLIISHDIYNGRKNQAIVEKFRPIVKKSITQYINDLVNDRIKAALNQAQPNSQITQNSTTNSSAIDSEHINKISTIQEELEAFAIIKILLKDNIPLNKITYKDTESYFGILYDNNTWKWICRLILDSNKKYLILPDENRKPQKYSIKSVNDLFSYSDQLKKVVERYTSC